MEFKRRSTYNNSLMVNLILTFLFTFPLSPEPVYKCIAAGCSRKDLNIYMNRSWSM